MKAGLTAIARNTAAHDVARGSVIMAIAAAGECAIRFVQKIILARLLVPHDFGLAAAVLAAVSLLESIADIGLRQAVIQSRRGASPAFLQAVWLASMVRGVTLASVAYVAAPFIAMYVRDPGATDLMRVACFGILISSVISPRVYVLEKEMRFGIWTIIMQSASVASALAAVVLSYVFKSALALVLAYVIEIAIRVILSYVICPFRVRLHAMRDDGRELFQFTRGMAGLPALTMICGQIDLYVLGRMVSLPLLGCYSLAKMLSEVPCFLTYKIINPVYLPSLARIKEQPALLIRQIAAAAEANALFVLPLVGVMALCAPSVMRMVYGPDYTVAAPAFAVLSVHAFVFSSASMLTTLLIAMGRPEIVRRAVILRMIVGAALVYPLIRTIGMVGAAWAIGLSGLSVLVVQLAFLRRMIDLRIASYLRTWMPGLRNTLACVVVPWFIASHHVEDEQPVFIITALGAGFSVLLGFARLLAHNEIFARPGRMWLRSLWPVRAA